MKLSLGIVGLPNVGKSTLFKHLTHADILVANYPFATIDPNVGVVAVPDERRDALAALSGSKKNVPAIVEFYDIAGLVKGASEGQGLGNQFLSHIRETQAIVMVLRVFGDTTVMHVEGDIDAVRDLETIETELLLKDLETATKRVTSLEKEARTGDKTAAAKLETLRAVVAALEAGERVAQFADEPVVRELSLLTAKPQLFLINGVDAEIPEPLRDALTRRDARWVVANLADEPDLTELIRAAYYALGLISFFTTGEDETRAWTTKRGATAPQAAGEIHSDFERTFIRAEVVSTEDLRSAGSWAAARQKGKLRVEGKEYVVQDGDVLVVRHG